MAKATTERDPLIHALTVLTVLSGIADAISYLGLGHVFTANMTGNVVVIGFALAGWPGFSAPASLLSLAAFLCGAAGAGRLASTYGGRRRWMLTAVSAEATLAAVCAVISFAHHGISTGAARFTVIALLAFAMGVRNATVRRMAVPDPDTDRDRLRLVAGQGQQPADHTAGERRSGHRARRLSRSGADAECQRGLAAAALVRHRDGDRPLLHGQVTRTGR